MPMNVCCRHTFKLEHTRTDKENMKHDWALFKHGISMSTNLVILRRLPVGLCLMSKAGHLRVLTTAFLLMETIMSPWQLLSFFSFSFFYRARREDILQFQDKIWIEERTYFGVLTYLPHTWSLQNFKCMEFKSPSVVVPSSRHIVTP